MRIWIGRAQCALTPAHDAFAEGYRGAFVNFACAAEGAAACVTLLERELAENGFQIAGFDWFIDADFADKTPSDYHAKLIGRLDTYPVQFEDVHLYKLDS